MRVATGKRFERVSEDPIAAQTVIRTDARLRALSQYQRNITFAKTRTSTEEAVLDQVTDIMTRAKELALAQGSSTSTAESREITASEVDQLVAQVLQLGNTKVGNEYIFGGAQTTSPPFDDTGSYLGDAVRRQVRIGAGYEVDTNHTGGEMLVDSSVIPVLQDLADQLRTGTADDVSAMIADIDDAFADTQGLLADIGGLQRQYDLASENIEALDVNLKTVRSEARDIGLDEATIDFVAVQTSLQAAMASAQRILSVNLTEFLR
jgi:flagellar hook-associated protein 3 FlgL